MHVPPPLEQTSFQDLRSSFVKGDLNQMIFIVTITYDKFHSKEIKISVPVRNNIEG
jgi:hypothetical protein